MKVKYFEDTDALYIALSERQPAETRELNENIMLELDADGKLVALTVEHAKDRQASGNIDFSFEKIAA